MTTKYKVQGSVKITPVWFDKKPEIQWSVNSVSQNLVLDQPKILTFDFDADPVPQTLSIELINKTDSDCDPTQGLDMAVTIDAIEFFGIHDPRFVWAGLYTPVYPEPWASEQTDLEPVLKHHTYLGWPGKWTLTFDVPVFTWIHHVQNLGWIYD